MISLLRVVLAGLLLLMLSYAVLHNITFTALPANAQGEVEMITQGQLGGRITSEEGGEPIAKVEVTAINQTAWESHGYAYSDQTGTYTLTLTPGHNYKLLFDPPNTSPYALQYYPNKRTKEEAETIVGHMGEPVRLDVALLRGGARSGAR